MKLLCGLLMAACPLSLVSAVDDEPLSFAFTLDAPGQRVAIDDYRLHVWCKGEGETTVLFEAGLGGSSLEWIPVQQAVAAKTRACIYDRAGYGWSDPSPYPSHARELARSADLLLGKLNVNGSLILVGHSFGGFVVRELSRLRQRQIAGLVLVDASHENQLARLEGNGRKRMMPEGNNFVVSPASVPDKLPEDIKRKIKAFSRMRKTFVALRSEMSYFRTSARQVQMDRLRADYPVVVISRGKDLYAQTDDGRRKTRIWNELQQDLTRLSSRSSLIIAEHSGHHVHADQPELVVDVIHDLIQLPLNNAAKAGDNYPQD